MWPLKYCLGKTSPVLRVSTHIYSVSKDIGGKMFIFQTKPRHVTPQINCLSKTWALFWGFQHTFMGILWRYMGKHSFFRVNLGMWPLKSIVLEKQALFWGFKHTFIVFPRTQVGKCSFFQSKPRHVTPQMDHLGKQTLILRVSTHIYSGFQGHRWENIHFFRLNLGMWPLKSNHVLEKRALFWWFQHTFIVFPRDIGGKMFIFSSKSGHVTPQIDCLGKMSTVLRVSTHIYSGFQGHRWENIHFSD